MASRLGRPAYGNRDSMKSVTRAKLKTQGLAGAVDLEMNCSDPYSRVKCPVILGTRIVMVAHGRRIAGTDGEQTCLRFCWCGRHNKDMARVFFFPQMAGKRPRDDVSSADLRKVRDGAPPVFSAAGERTEEFLILKGAWNLPAAFFGNKVEVLGSNLLEDKGNEARAVDIVGASGYVNVLLMLVMGMAKGTNDLLGFVADSFAKRPGFATPPWHGRAGFGTWARSS